MFLRDSEGKIMGILLSHALGTTLPGEDRKTEEMGRVHGTIEAYTKVPPSGLIDKIVKITLSLLKISLLNAVWSNF